MYHFEGRITRRDGYCISRDVSHVVMVTIIEGRVVRHDRCMDRYVPHGSRTERQRVCTTRSDMHHYTWHCISLLCTYLSLVNLIWCSADLVIALLRNLWLLNTELVIEDMQFVKVLLWRICNFSKYFCLVTFYVNCELLGWLMFMQVVVVEVRLGVVGVPKFLPLSLCLKVYLLSTVWFGTHPLLLRIFVGY